MNFLKKALRFLQEFHWAVALPAGAVLAAFSGFMPRTIGIAMILYGAVQAQYFIRDSWDGWTLRLAFLRHAPAALSRWVPPAAVACVWAWLLRKPLSGQMPLSQDHNVHYFKAWLLTHKLIPHGTIQGWSNFWFAGYPTETFYPPGGDLLVAAFYYLGLTLVPLEVCYAVAVAVAYLLPAIGLFVLARRAFGGWAAMAAALFFLLDKGAFREGGWEHTMYWGVWPQMLGLGFFLLSLAAFDSLFVSLCGLEERPGRSVRLAAASGLLLGIAFLSHPMTVPFAALSVPVLGLCTVVSEGRKVSGRLVLYSAAAFSLAVLIAAFYLLPQAARSDWAVKAGAAWLPLPELVLKLLKGGLFQNFWALPYFLGLAGAVVGLVKRDRYGLCASLLLLLSVTVPSSTALTETGITDVLTPLSGVQFHRFALLLKVLIFFLSGYSLAALAQAAGRSGVSVPRSPLAVAALALALAPLLPHLAVEPPKRLFEGVGGVISSRSVAEWNDYRRFLDWSRQEADASPGFWRIAYHDEKNLHFFATAPAYNGIPMIKIGFNPAEMFKYKFSTDDPEALRSLAVRYVVSRREYGRGKPWLEEVKRFGIIRVYALKDPSFDLAMMKGSGSCRVERFEDEYVKLEVSGAAAGSRVRLHVAPYASWKAYMNGAPARILSAQLNAGKSFEETPTFMEVEAENGAIEFRYERSAGEWMSKMASAAAILVSLCLVLLPLSRLSAAISKAVLRAEGGVRIAFIAFLVVLAPCLAAAGQRARAGFGSGGGKPVYVFRNHMEDASVQLRGAAGKHVRDCREKRGGDFFCGPEEWKRVGETLLPVANSFRRCIWFHPVSRNELRLTFRDVPLKGSIEGRFGFEDESVDNTPPGSFATFRVDAGAQRGEFRAENRKEWQAFSLDTSALSGGVADVSFSVTAQSDYFKHFCFDAAVVEAPGADQ